jgi:hypothetical protein
MRTCLSFLAVFLCACPVFGQVDFECAPLGALSANPASNCEGVNSNNMSTLIGVSATASCAFPITGTQYLVIGANGASGTTAVNVPAGGPLPRPLNAVISEVRVPIPAGASSVTLSWEFFNAEALAGSFNDGISIDVVTPAGALVGNLVYADAATGESTCLAVAGSQETIPPGPQSFSGVLPPHAACDFISIAVFNEGDDAVDSRAYVDTIFFDTAGGACPPPCFGPLPPPPTLAFSSPSGPGSLQVNLSGLNAGGFYLLAVTLNPPPGWFFGINIGVTDLANQIYAGFPFSGPLSFDMPCIGGGGAAQIGPFFGAPSAVTLHAVGLGLSGGGLGGPVTIGEVTPAVSYTIP